MSESCSNCECNIYNQALSVIAANPELTTIVNNSINLSNCIIRRIKQLCISEEDKNKMIHQIIKLSNTISGIGRQPAAYTSLISMQVTSMIAIFDMFYPIDKESYCHKKSPYKRDFCFVFGDVSHLQNHTTITTQMIDLALMNCYCNKQ